jgi:hypothetical protein
VAFDIATFTIGPIRRAFATLRLRVKKSGKMTFLGFCWEIIKKRG